MAVEKDRTRRVAAVLQRELAAILASELSDPRLARVTVTDVRLTRDLKSARVYVTRLPARQPEAADHSDEQIRARHREVVAALDGAAGMIRRMLAARAELRSVPRLAFEYDPSIERGVAMTGLIDAARRTDRG